MLPLLGLLLPLGKTILGSITGHFEHKRKLKAEKQAAELEWAKYMAQASGKSWKDEYLTIVWTLPIVLGMFGWITPLERLLIILQQIPEWYTYLLLVITLASFGLSANGKWKELQTRQQMAVEKVKQNGQADSRPTYGQETRSVSSHGTNFEIFEE